MQSERGLYFTFWTNHVITVRSNGRMCKINIYELCPSILSCMKRSVGKRPGTYELMLFLCLLLVISFCGCKKTVEDDINALKKGSKRAEVRLERIGIDKLEPAQQAVYFFYTDQPEKVAMIGRPAVEPCVEALKNEFNVKVQCRAAEVLGKIGNANAIEPLMTVLKMAYRVSGGGYYPPEVAAEALEKIGIEKMLPAQQATYFVYTSQPEKAAKVGQLAVQPCIVALNEGLGPVPRFAAEALGEIGDPEAVEPLIAFLARTNSYDDAESAAEALGRIGDTRAVIPLIACLTNEAWSIRCTACEALAQIGQPAVDRLRERPTTNSPEVIWIQIALTLCGNQESAALVLEGLKRRGPRAEYRCLLLGWFGSPELTPQLDQLPLGKELREYARAQRLTDSEWNQVVQKTVDDPSRIEFTLSALSVSPQNSKRQSQVEDLCLRYIRRGNILIIPQLRRLLNLYGNKKLAEDYLNCGQSDLDNAARAWASAHGYSIKRGRGSARALWGSDKR